MSDEKALPLRKLVMKSHVLANGMQLRYAIIDPPVATPSFTLLTVPGLGETIAKKDFELGDTISALGGRHIIYEPRGQGASSRYLEGKKRQRSFVPAFSSYTDDLTDFFSVVSQKFCTGPLFIYGHSTGGLTLLSWLSERNVDLAAALVTAPALSLSMPSSKILPGSNFEVPTSLALLIAKFFVSLGRASAYASGEGDKKPSFKKQKLTHDRDRFEWFESYLKFHSEEKMGGVTWGWLNAILAEGRRLRRGNHLAKIAVPLLVILSGKDPIVPSAKIEKPLAKIPDVQVVTVPHAWHEIMSEASSFRDPALMHFAEFIMAHLRS